MTVCVLTPARALGTQVIWPDAPSCRPVRSCQLLYVSCQLSAVICQLSAVTCQLSAVICQLSAVVYQLLAVICHLSTIICQLSPVCCQLSDVICKLAQYCQLSDVICKLAQYCQLSTSQQLSAVLKNYLIEDRGPQITSSSLCRPCLKAVETTSNISSPNNIC